MAVSIRITKAPCFFKVLINDDFSTQLKIPDSFMKRFGELCKPKQILLKTGSDQFWRVDVAKANGSVYFRKGWERFVKDNLLEQTDFVVFKHVKNSTFKVKMYGSHGCEKRVQVVREHTKVEDTTPTTKHQKPRSPKNHIPREGFKEVKTESADDNFIDIDPPSDNEEDERKSAVKKRRSKGGIEERNTASAALEEAKRFKSKFPFFHVVLQRSYVNSAMYMPTRFYKTYMKEREMRAKLEVAGRLWSVGLKGRGPGNSNYVKMAEGWKVFSRNNNLKPGDVCVFEMTNRVSFVFRVHIFRC